MDIVIYTSDPEAVDADQVDRLLTEAGYYVASVTIQER